MKIGLVTEGHSDRAVIVNILEGLTNLDKNDFIPILPVFALDETDLAMKTRANFGGWPAVKRECEEREFIDLFFEREGDNFLVIHFDTAESAQYGIKQPQKDHDYATELRNRVIEQIMTWMQTDSADQLLFAIAVEEMDAWILTIVENRDSTKSSDAKSKLEYLKGFRRGKMKPDFDLYSDYSRAFREESKQTLAKYISRNKSLEAFYNEVTAKVLPRLNN
jgi:hypothetical protein